MSPTTRTYPRTMAQAFPRDHADPIERPPSRLADKAVTLVLWIAVVAIILSIAFQGVAK